MVHLVLGIIDTRTAVSRVNVEDEVGRQVGGGDDLTERRQPGLLLLVDRLVAGQPGGRPGQVQRGRQQPRRQRGFDLRNGNLLVKTWLICHKALPRC